MNAQRKPQESGIRAVPGCQCGACQQLIQKAETHRVADIVSNWPAKKDAVAPQIFFGKAAR